MWFLNFHWNGKCYCFIEWETNFTIVLEIQIRKWMDGWISLSSDPGSGSVSNMAITLNLMNGWIFMEFCRGIDSTDYFLNFLIYVQLTI